MQQVLSFGAAEELKSLSPEKAKHIQELLNRKGYPCGVVDGKVGPKTLAAWAKFKTDFYMDTTLSIIGPGSYGQLLKLPDIQTPRHMGENGLKLLKAFEGCELKAYRDSVNVLTIGYGLTNAAGVVHIHEGMKITQQQAEEYLKKALGKYEQAVRDAVKVLLNQNEFDALVSWAYNVGPVAMKGSTLVKVLNDGDRAQASQEFLKWNKAGGRVLSGLTRRRRCESALFKSDSSWVNHLNG